MRTIKMLAAFAVLATFAACDYAAKKDLADERESRSYRAAMADYSAGRIDAAVEGFAKTIREEPANAGARFQYACLLQDSGKDILEAFCAYHEYILQHPESDKAGVAAKRMAICEKELAKMLAEKHGIVAGELPKKLDEAKSEAADLRNRLAAAEKELEDSRRRIKSLESDRGRLIAIVKGIGDDEGEVAVSVPTKTELKDVLEAEDVDDGERARISAAVARLREEEKSEVETGSSLLPARKPEDVAKRDAEKAAAEQKRMEDALAAAPKHPSTYVVQEGDTLYRIAVRFYGRLSAWKKIRDANKAIISNDGRVRAGDTITLP